jgi:hypothetical protein
MSQAMRQTGMVIGLTMILTFPVTVVSGAGSQKQSDHMVRKVGVPWKSPSQVQSISPFGEHRIPTTKSEPREGIHR